MSGSAQNGIYNYGAGDPAVVTDRAVGWISSSGGTKSGNLYAFFKNNSGLVLTEFVISYNIEKYRNGSNPSGFRIQMYYSKDGINWTSAGSNFLSTFSADSDNNGFTNAPGTTTSVTNQSFFVVVPDGDSLFLAWNYSVASGSTTSNAQALGIDDFSILGLDSPFLLPNQTSLTGFTYVEGSGPSASQNFVINAYNLDPSSDTLYISGSDRFEVSFDNTTFGQVSKLAYTVNTFIDTIYVRMKAGLSFGTYSNDTVPVSGGSAASKYVLCSGIIYKAEPTNHVTNFSSSAGVPPYAVIVVTWTDAVGGTVPDGYLIKGSPVGFGSITDPVDGTAETNSSLVKNVAAGLQTSSFTGLNPSSTYYFKIYPYTNSGVNINYKTDGSVPQLSRTTDPPPAGSLLFEENFQYNAGQLTSASGGANVSGGNWIYVSGTGNYIQVSDGNLSYPGYTSSSIGRQITIISPTSSAEDVRRTIPDQTASGTKLYAAFLINVTNRDGLDTISGNYFAHFTNVSGTGGGFHARVFCRRSGNGIQFGLQGRTDGTTKWISTVRDTGTTYLITVGYEIVSGDDNNISRLWVNPVLSGLEPTSDVADTNIVSGSSDPDGIDAFGIRQDSDGGVTTPNAIIDGIRVALDWENGPVPVELSSFTAVLNNNKVILNWQTETEVNNYGFEVLKSESKNQQTEWQTIGFVEGYGNSNSPKSYSYTDNLTQNSAQTLRYRLKQIDNDGQYSYSKEIEVSTHERMRYELDQNYPNPFNPVTKITFTMPETGEVKLTVYNVVGEKVKELINGKLEKGRHSVEFDGRELSSGMYIYRLETGRFSDQKKMILIK
jgi:hypothetical protein